MRMKRISPPGTCDVYDIVHIIMNDALMLC